MINEVTYTLNVNNRSEFFTAWVNILQPIIKVRPKEVEFLATLLECRNTISKMVSNDDEIDTLLFSTIKRKEMREKLNMDEFAFNTLLLSLRKKKIITKNKINKKLIPVISDDMETFTLKFKLNVKQ